jgi:hypothetical protein
MKTLATCTYILCWTLAAFYNTYELAIWTLWILLFLDSISWLIKWFRLGKASSYKLAYWIIAKVLIAAIPLWLNLLFKQTGLWEIGESFISIVFSTLSVAELISFIQNIVVIRTWIEQKEQDVISWILSSILSVLNWVFDKLKEKISNTPKVE